MEKPPVEPPQPPRERDDVKVNAHRCPYCRDDVTAAESVVCRDCLTRHHPACWDEPAKCSSCGSTARLASERPPLTDERVGELLREHGYSEAEVAAHLARQRVGLALCAMGDCVQPGSWTFGPGAARLCEGHARTQNRQMTWLVGGLSAFVGLLAVGTAIGGWLAHERELIPLGGLFLVLALVLGVLARWFHRKGVRPRKTP